MARVAQIATMLRSLSAECPDCEYEINLLLIGLKSISSLKDGALESLGYEKRHIGRSIDLVFSRRRYSVELARCGGIVSFYWKKARVDHLSVKC
jgi:hypothetical protein